MFPKSAALQNNDLMPTWKKALLVNGGGVIGIAMSLFIVPAQTSFWLWVVVAVTVLMVLNYIFLIWRRTGEGDQGKPNRSTVLIFVGCIVLLLDLVLRYLHR